MSNYSTEIKTAELNENGLSKNAGWVTVYHVHPVTREYLSASYEYLMVGVGLPADSYIDEPELPVAGLALRRSADGKAWEHVPDYRGQTVYDTQTRQQQTVDAIGELPDNVTLSAPATEFDIWDGEAWVTDEEAQQQAAAIAKQQDAQKELSTRQVMANERIQTLTDAIDLGMATEEETAELEQWKKYRVLLSRIDTAASEIVWPEAPTVS
ncbi:phage tail protein [Brenneria alni]|uniref:Phage tail protein n=1 Tax=Brenneria alni TaxID=71656 RepID=A0A421DQ85_9GAMM|nr:tail fiber assembly protein [Brenneria alni]RLM25321.1 phage tail protein [Brenneria alni]